MTADVEVLVYVLLGVTGSLIGVVTWQIVRINELRREHWSCRNEILELRDAHAAKLNKLGDDIDELSNKLMAYEIGDIP